MLRDESGDLSRWKEKIRSAKAYQDKGGRRAKWRRNRGWYRNEYSSSTVSVNLVFSQGRALVPQLYFKAPTILVRPRKQQYVEHAKVVEAVDAWLIEHIGLKKQLKSLIVDAFLTNIGVGKIGYNTLSTELPSPNDETTELVADMMGAPVGEVQEDLKRRKWSYHDFIKPDSPWFLRIKPEDVLCPWGFTDEHETPWLAYRVIRPTKDIKDDDAYKNTSRLQANAVPELGLMGTISPNQAGAISTSEFTELFEIWDKRDGKIRVLSMDHDKWLRDEEHNLDLTGLPSVVLRFNPDGEDFWGVPDCEHIHKQVIELNENRTHEIVTKRLANIKALVDKNKVSDVELQKAEKGAPGPFIRCDGDPSSAMTQFSFSVPPDFWRVDEVIRRDIRDTLGWSRNQQGEFHPGRKTATEVEVVQEAFQLRSDERRDQVADLLTELFRDKIHPLIFQHWTQSRTMQVTALGGWYQFTGEQIRGDYDVLVVPDSVLPMSRHMQQQLAKDMFMAFKGDPRVRQRELYLAMLGTIRELIPDPDAMLVPEDEYQKMQQQQQQQMLMLALLKATHGKMGAPGQGAPQGGGQQGANVRPAVRQVPGNGRG